MRLAASTKSIFVSLSYRIIGNTNKGKFILNHINLGMCNYLNTKQNLGGCTIFVLLSLPNFTLDDVL
jgi:hypothetical protein